MGKKKVKKLKKRIVELEVAVDELYGLYGQFKEFREQYYQEKIDKLHEEVNRAMLNAAVFQKHEGVTNDKTPSYC